VDVASPRVRLKASKRFTRQGYVIIVCLTHIPSQSRGRARRYTQVSIAALAQAIVFKYGYLAGRARRKMHSARVKCP